MTRDEIIRMAREAGAVVEAGLAPVFSSHSELVKFAHLVESAHEIRAQSAYSRGYACGVAEGDATVEAVRRERDLAYKNGAGDGVKTEQLRLLRIVLEVAPAFGKTGECMALAVRARNVGLGELWSLS
jgi:hypothetical protein